MLGFPLIFLSLFRDIFLKNHDIRLKAFNYIYSNLREQRKYIDRLAHPFLI